MLEQIGRDTTQRSKLVQLQSQVSHPGHSDFGTLRQCSVLRFSALSSLFLFSLLLCLFLFLHSKMKMDLCEVRAKSRRCYLQKISVPFLSSPPKCLRDAQGWQPNAALQVSWEWLAVVMIQAHSSAVFAARALWGFCSRLRINVEGLAGDRRPGLQR